MWISFLIFIFYLIDGTQRNNLLSRLLIDTVFLFEIEAFFKYLTAVNLIKDLRRIEFVFETDMSICS